MSDDKPYMPIMCTFVEQLDGSINVQYTYSDGTTESVPKSKPKPQCKWHGKAEPRANFERVRFSVRTRAEEIPAAIIRTQETERRKLVATQHLKRVLLAWPTCASGNVSLTYTNNEAYYACSCMGGK
jgi:hypothetical protein